MSGYHHAPYHSRVSGQLVLIYKIPKELVDKLMLDRMTKAQIAAVLDLVRHLKNEQ